MMVKIQVASLMCLSSFLIGSSTWAVPIAIIDSGVDVKHSYLKGKIWTNPGGISGDSYSDDLHGWNFADGNNRIIDYSYLGKFSPDTTKYFEVQLRVLDGTATDDDKKWINSKKDDENFIQELEAFGNFVHGTHVAGISSHLANSARVMAAKIIPTEVKDSELTTSSLISFFENLGLKIEGAFHDAAMDTALWFLANDESKTLADVGKYVGVTGMRVANCSFGTNVMEARQVVGMVSKSVLHLTLNDTDVDKYATYFVEKVLADGSTFVESANQTLFVFAAGNDGTNNDQVPVFPANLRYDNTISVAATRGYSRLASFSNYGVGHVDIAAPGVGILSSIPGGKMLTLSGTSQAAPLVSNVAGRILDTNPKLSLLQVKEVLMKTVDKKEFLKDKVASGGIVNPDRAIRAAELSTSLGLAHLQEAIDQARTEISDVDSIRTLGFRDLMMPLSTEGANDSRDDGEPIRLPSMFRMSKDL